MYDAGLLISNKSLVSFFPFRPLLAQGLCNQLKRCMLLLRRWPLRAALVIMLQSAAVLGFSMVSAIRLARSLVHKCANSQDDKSAECTCKQLRQLLDASRRVMQCICAFRTLH